MRTEVGGGPPCPPGAGATDAPGALVSQVLRPPDAGMAPRPCSQGTLSSLCSRNFSDRLKVTEPRVGLKQEGSGFPGGPPASTPCSSPFQICNFLFLLRRVTTEGVWALRWVGWCGFLAHVPLLTPVTATLLIGEQDAQDPGELEWAGQRSLRGPPGQADTAQEVSPHWHFISTCRALSLPPGIAQVGCDLRKHP